MQPKNCFQCGRLYRFDLLEKCPACGLRTKFQSTEYDSLEENAAKELLEASKEDSHSTVPSRNARQELGIASFESSNYHRGNVFRDFGSLKITFPGIFDDPLTVGSNAFIIAFKKEDDNQGILLSDLVHLVIRNREIFLLGFPEVLFQMPVDKLTNFEFASIDIPLLFFPPGIPPQRVGMFEMEWLNSEGKYRRMHLLFPDFALYPFELEFPSEKVHGALGDLNQQKKFQSNPYYNSERLKAFAKNLISHIGGTPNEVSKMPCYFNRHLEINN